MSENYNTTENIKDETPWEDDPIKVGLGVMIAMGFILGIFFLLVSSNTRVFITSYKVTSPITIQTIDANTRISSQNISFTDDTGAMVTLTNVTFDGDTGAETLYVYRIGEWDWVSKVFHSNDGKIAYYVTDTPLDTNDATQEE